MSNYKTYTKDEANVIGQKLGIDFEEINLEQFRRGLEVEMEHGSHDPQTNVTNNNELLTGKIAWVHLKEIPDYYKWLDEMEREAEEYWENQNSL